MSGRVFVKMDSENTGSFRKYARFKPGKLHQKIGYVMGTTPQLVYIANNMYLNHLDIVMKRVISIKMKSMAIDYHLHCKSNAYSKMLRENKRLTPYRTWTQTNGFGRVNISSQNCMNGDMLRSRNG